MYKKIDMPFPTISRFPERPKLAKPDHQLCVINEKIPDKYQISDCSVWFLCPILLLLLFSCLDLFPVCIDECL